MFGKLYPDKKIMHNFFMHWLYRINLISDFNCIRRNMGHGLKSKALSSIYELRYIHNGIIIPLSHIVESLT